MNNAKVAKANFLSALESAGYGSEPYENVALIAERFDRFVFLVDDDQGEYLVGEFWKATTTSAADFGFAPVWSGENFAEGAQYMLDWLGQL